MEDFNTLTMDELQKTNGGSVLGILTLLGGAYTAGYLFGSDLAKSDRRRSGK